jgi:cardiolipin synthase A/B
LHPQKQPSEIRRSPASRFRLLSRLFPAAPVSEEPSLLAPGLEVIPGNAADLLPTGDEVLAAMLSAIRNATRAIDVEMYCFADDFVGCRFARALAERASHGLAVRVLVDAAGCRLTPRSFFGWMRERGIRVRGVNPIRKFFLSGGLLRWRDHRKILVVDGAAAFVGGLNLSRDYASEKEGGAGWRDAAIRLTGPAVGALTSSFERQWREVGFTAERPAAAPPVPPAAGDVSAVVLESRPVGPGPFASVFRHAIDRARRRIWIANPYFLPPRSFRRALRRAAGRGVDVRVLLPRWSDSAFVLRASQRAYAYYLRSGLRIFEWPGPMMHSKAAVVDGLWSTIGSYNIDPLSLLVNRELNVVLLGRGPGSRFEAMFEQDFSRSQEIDAERWKARSPLRRLQEQLCASFRVFL